MNNSGYMPEYEAKKVICDIAKILVARRLVSAAAGSISIRCGKNTAWITPDNTCLAFLTPDKLVRVDLSGRPAYGIKQAPLAAEVHKRIYTQAEETMAVIDTSPPFIAVLEQEKRYAIVPVDVKAQDLKLCDRAKEDRIFLMDGKRLICWAESIWKAYEAIEKIDYEFYEAGCADMAQSNGNTEEKQNIISQIVENVTKIVLKRLSTTAI